MKKYKRPQEKVLCEECKTKFLKDSSEVKRNLKLGRKCYCTISCSKKNKENIKHLSQVRSRDISKLNPSNRLDEYSIFRPHLRRAKRRRHFCDLTLEQMKEVWDKQQGICTYSKVKLQIADHKKENNSTYTISLDRIDSNKGYTKGNIQFISMAMNYLKNKMSHKEMLVILNIIKYGI